jgi:peptidyl-tRNA hydrolase
MTVEPRLYILVRNDLASMTPGRVAAQASHASNVFVKDASVMDRKRLKMWEAQTDQGFGTAIVLAASSKQIDDVLFAAGSKGVMGMWIVDPEYGIRVTAEVHSLLPKSKFKSDKLPNGEYVVYRSEKTCAYLFGTKPEVDPFVGTLPLY